MWLFFSPKCKETQRESVEHQEFMRSANSVRDSDHVRNPQTPKTHMWRSLIFVLLPANQRPRMDLSDKCRNLSGWKRRPCCHFLFSPKVASAATSATSEDSPLSLSQKITAESSRMIRHGKKKKRKRKPILFKVSRLHKRKWRVIFPIVEYQFWKQRCKSLSDVGETVC